MPSTVPSYGSAGTGGSSSYYGTNLANYGNYSTYAAQQQQQAMTSPYYSHHYHHTGLPNVDKSASDLYVAPAAGQQSAYSVHVRASPICPRICHSTVLRGIYAP